MTPFDASEHDAAALLARRSSVGDDVYEVLLSRLISLKIPPGARIGVDQLARELGVSQTPIRAALIRLETEGLVNKTHLVGFSAAPLPSRQRFEEIYQLRLLLEPYAAERAATALTAAGRAELAALAEAMARPSAEEAQLAYGKFANADARFHALIARVGGGELMAETLARLHTHMHLFRVLFHSRVTEEAIAEHARLLDALVAGDGPAARKAMASHIRQSLQRVAPILDTLDEGATPSGRLRLADSSNPPRRHA
ncbi:GntR family transcriptional regulator [Ramlibacter aurantiacus]|uniref:GntR family transcriptional regulator n=1 Tax=Ramlibacter aurantiacus TaxID=2801330 RepID=UPI00338E6094